MSVPLLKPDPNDGGGIAAPVTSLARLGLDAIGTDGQVRLDFDPEALASLTSSLKTSGQIVPILAYFDPDRNRHIIIDGERRYRAAKAADIETLEAVVFPFKPTAHEVAIVQITIDQQREDLNPIEKAQAYAQVMKANGWNATELAGHIQVADTTIMRAVDLLKLSPDFQDLIRSGTLPTNIARELARLPEEQRLAAWKQIQDEGLNGNGAQKLVTKLLKPKKKTGRPKSKDKHTYKNLAGFEAVVSLKKLTLVPTPGKPRTAEQMLSALEMLVQKFREDILKEQAKGQSGSVVAIPNGQDSGVATHH